MENGVFGWTLRCKLNLAGMSEAHSSWNPLSLPSSRRTMRKPRRANKNLRQKNVPQTILERKSRKSETEHEKIMNRALITRWWRIVLDLGWNSSRTKMGMNPRTNGGKWRTSIKDFCGTGGNYAWRRFQDKWGRSATL